MYSKLSILRGYSLCIALKLTDLNTKSEFSRGHALTMSRLLIIFSWPRINYVMATHYFLVATRYYLVASPYFVVATHYFLVGKHYLSRGHALFFFLYNVTSGAP